MSKKKNKKSPLVGINFGNKSVIATVSNSLNKHGRIKGESKKETKALVEACPHHRINKNGKIKPAFMYDRGNGTATCKLCGKTWAIGPDDIQQVEKKIKRVQENVDQAKVFNVAINGGEASQRYLAEMSMGLSTFPKVYDRLSKTVKKQDSIKKNKKKNNRNQGSMALGSWR